MGIFNLILGLFIIGIGFLMKAYPNLIAGYNTMSKDQKKNVDIERATVFFRNGLIIIGLIIMVGYNLFKWIGLIAIANSIAFVSILLGTTIMVIVAQKFDHNKRKNIKLVYLILGLTMLFVVGLIAYGSIPTKTFIENDKITFTGMCGVEIQISELKDVELTDKIPSIRIRTNGFGFGTTQKGTFRLDEFGSCKLFLNASQGPFLILTTQNGQKTIINNKNCSITRENYNKIKALINK